VERAEIAPPPVHRLLEVGTAGLTVLVSSAPVWAALLAPELWTLAFALFTVYWLYCSSSVVLYGLIGYLRIRQTQRRDWVAALEQYPSWRQMHHLVAIPICGEPLPLLGESLAALAQQTFPTDQVTVLLAFEARDAAAARKAAQLRERFQHSFAAILATSHRLRPGAVPGKGSNLSHAVPIAQQALAERGLEPDQVLVTICDADSRLDPNYLAAVTYRYLAAPSGDRCIFQPAMLFYANRDRLPVWARVVDGLYSVLQLARLAPTYKLVSLSTYSLSLAALQRTGYWDVDVVAEDSHMFFKFFFRHQGQVTPTPIYLPVWADAAEGANVWETAWSHYRQARRWAWGVSDVPYVAWQALTGRGLSLRARLSRPFHYTLGHLLWPAHWFLLLGGLKIVREAHPAVALSANGRELANLSSALLTATLPCLLGVIALDYALQRLHSRGTTLPDLAALPIWFLLPLVGFLLNVLPAIEAHLRLLLGRPLEYEVTQKLTAVPSLSPVPTRALPDRRVV